MLMERASVSKPIKPNNSDAYRQQEREHAPTHPGKPDDPIANVLPGSHYNPNPADFAVTAQ